MRPRAIRTPVCNPNAPEVHAALAQAHPARAEWKAAASDFRRATELGLRSGEIYFGWSRALLEQGDSVAALEKGVEALKQGYVAGRPQVCDREQVRRAVAQCGPKPDRDAPTRRR